MKIEKLVLLTNDLQGTKDFYSVKLNLEIIKEGIDHISLRAGRTVLVFKTNTIPNPVYHIAFNISNNKIEEAEQWCEAKGLELLSFPGANKIIDFPNWNAKSIYFLDNSGNILEFIARLDLKNESYSPFNQKQILSVSEIGIVVDDVNEFCRTTTKEYTIPTYEKHKPAPDFSVMGDAEGLLIVVPEKRKWFPTSILSNKFPVEMVLEQSGTQYHFSS